MDYAQKYNTARVEYLKAVLNNNTDKEIQNLKILIATGKKLKKNTSKYEKELKKFRPKPKVVIKKIEPIKVSKPKAVKKPAKPKVNKTTTSSKYTIKKVYTKANSVVIEFNTNISNKYVKFHEERNKGYYEDVYDLKGSFKDAEPTKLVIPGVGKVIITQKDKNTLRIIFRDKKSLKTIYFVNRNKVVLKVTNITKKTSKINKVKVSTSPKIARVGRGRIIVLDAGHGGKDVGAVGKRKRYEKIAVFKVTKYLQSILKNRGYKVFMTRTSDKFIQLKNRTYIANKKNANIFVSIHANAAPKSKVHKARGLETFFLSPARSERAKRVAAKENKSDIRKMNYSSKNALLSVLNQSRITASNKLAIDIHKNMLFSARSRYKDAVDGGVREGPFWVLVGAQMPSVLIELGYISHPEEGRRLYEKKYQQKLAIGIANGIDSYFAKNP